jgi:hypothetical protein
VQVLKQNKHQKNLLFIAICLAIFFLVNILIKWKMFGQYTNTAQESWLSGVSSIFVQNWLNEGIFNLKFGMFRTFDSVEMRDFGDREAYTSFLPGCLILPYLVAKIFSFKASLVYFEIWACVYHFLGSLITGLITYLLAKRIDLSDSKALAFSLSSGFFYIFGFLTFMQLSFAYYTDTAVYLIYLFFLLTEFIDSPKKRLFIKAIILFIGISFEWFFLSITVISLISELTRKENKGYISSIWVSHLGPLFCTLAIYFYQLSLLDKLEHTYLRLLRRTALNSVSNSSFKHTVTDIWQAFCRRHGVVIVIAELTACWNIFESKFLKNNACYRNIFLVAFISSFVQIFVAFEHSAVHYFSGIKLFIPMIIFIPFLFLELAEKLSKTHLNKILVLLGIVTFTGNLYLLNGVMSRWQPEHKIYSQMQEVFKDYSYEDLFFSYNLQVLQDIYQKDDVKLDTKRIYKPADRSEGEPFTHLVIKKQIYHIDSPVDILTMINNRGLIDKAKVHIVFFDTICNSVSLKAADKITERKDFYIIDLSKDDLLKEDFLDKYSCDHRMRSRHYFAFGSYTRHGLK